MMLAYSLNKGYEISTSVLANHTLRMKLHRPNGGCAVAHGHQYAPFPSLRAVSCRDKAIGQCPLVYDPAVVASDITSRGDDTDKGIRRIYNIECGGVTVARRRELPEMCTIVLGQGLMSEADP